MKKILTATLLATAVLSTACFAKGEVEDTLMVCNYTDYFHISSDSPQNLVITSLTGDEKVVVGQNLVNGQKEPNAFFIKDTPACVRNGGYAHVHYQTDAKNYCDVAVHDAENFFHPEVSGRCAGNLKFVGSSYDGVNTHSYTLTFATA